MKKLVALAFIFYALSMAIMVGWGFIDKQIKESNLDKNETAQTSPSETQVTNQQTKNNPDSIATYSKGELASHSKPSDCWLAINGNVYDVTKYLDLHPGGADIVLIYCGKDATQAYKTQGGRGGAHSSRADAKLEEFKIGILK